MPTAVNDITKPFIGDDVMGIQHDSNSTISGFSGIHRNRTTSIFSGIHPDRTTSIIRSLSLSKRISSRGAYDLELKVSSPKTGFNIFNAIVGAGILALPYTFHLTGFTSLIVLAYFGIANSFTAISFTKCIDAMKEKRKSARSFKEITGVAWGHKSEVTVGIMFMVAMTGVMIAFLVLCGQTLASISPFNHKICTLASSILIYGLILVAPNLKKIFLLSSIGIVSTALCIVLVIVDALVFAKATKENLSPEYSFANYVTTFNIMASATSFHLGVPAHYSSMSNPSSFALVTNLVYTCMVIVKGVFMAIPALYYGGTTDGIIITNMQNTVLKYIVTIGIVIDKIVTMPLTSQILTMEIQQILKRRKIIRYSEGKWNVQRWLIAAIIMTMATVLAIFLPYFAFFQYLQGVTTQVTFVHILPCFLRLSICHNSFFEKVCLWFVALVGIFGVCSGMFFLVMNVSDGNYF